MMRYLTGRNLYLEKYMPLKVGSKKSSIVGGSIKESMRSADVRLIIGKRKKQIRNIMLGFIVMRDLFCVSLQHVC